MEEEAQPTTAPCTGEAGETTGEKVVVDPDTDTQGDEVLEEDEPDTHQQDDQTPQPPVAAAQQATGHTQEDEPVTAAGTVADNTPTQEAGDDQGTEGDMEQASVEECHGSSHEEDEEVEEDGKEGEDEDEEGEGSGKNGLIVETVVYSRMEYLDVISLDELQIAIPPNVGYRMDHPKRGVAVIFNNGTFSSLLELPDRVGYKEDGALLKEGFSAVGFDVRYYQDLTVQNIVTVLSLVNMEGHEDADCIAVVFMTHGLQQPGTTNDVIFGKDGPLWIHNIVAKFNGEGSPSLAGKPKLFFVEASRGTQVDTGVKADTQADAARRKKTIPLEADILLAQSTVAGYTSFPTEPSGSVYIRSLARTLTEYGRTQDIHWLLTRVNFLVAEQFESTSVDRATNRKRQMPVYSSTLTKVLSFPRPLKEDTEFYL